MHSPLPAAPSACALPGPRDALCRKGLGGFVRVAAPPTPPCNFLPGEGEGAGMTWCQAGKQCWEPSHSAQRLPDSLLTQAPWGGCEPNTPQGPPANHSTAPLPRSRELRSHLPQKAHPQLAPGSPPTPVPLPVEDHPAPRAPPPPLLAGWQGQDAARRGGGEGLGAGGREAAEQVLRPGASPAREAEDLPPPPWQQADS